MSFFSKKKETLHEVENRFNLTGLLEKPSSLREKIAILAIDDENFDPQTNLVNSGFNINVFHDIKRISDTQPYEIILCDVNGVGIDLSASTQGAYLIDEIKKSYPEKVVIAYTAGSSQSRLVNLSKQRADFNLRKDASIEEWRDLLDEIIKDICNPILTWKKERVRLLNSGVELSELIKIESALLKNLGKGSSDVRSAIESSIRDAGDGKTAWGREIGVFLASKSFDLAFGYIFQ